MLFYFVTQIVINISSFLIKNNKTEIVLFFIKLL